MIQELNTPELHCELINNPYGVQIGLSDSEIEHWKTTGNWKHIRKEIMNIPNTKFGCSNTDYGCIYFFFFHSHELRIRFFNMLISLFENDTKIPLIKCSNVTWRDGMLPLEDNPEAKTCNLF